MMIPMVVRGILMLTFWRGDDWRTIRHGVKRGPRPAPPVEGRGDRGTVVGQVNVDDGDVDAPPVNDRSQRAANACGDGGHGRVPLGNDFDVDGVRADSDAGDAAAGQIGSQRPQRASADTRDPRAAGDGGVDGVDVDAVHDACRLVRVRSRYPRRSVIPAVGKLDVVDGDVHFHDFQAGHPLYRLLDVALDAAAEVGDADPVVDDDVEVDGGLRFADLDARPLGRRSARSCRGCAP